MNTNQVRFPGSLKPGQHPLRLLFVIRSWGVGGEQKALSNISSQLLDRGHEIEILILSGKVEVSSPRLDPRVKVHLLSSQQPRNRMTGRLVMVARIRCASSEIDPDVVVGFGVAAGILSALALIGTSHPLTVCERNDPSVYSRSWKLLRRLAYKRANAAIFQTEDAAAYFKAGTFKYSEVIPNPVSQSPLNMQPTHKRKVVVNTSRLTEAKNHKMLIEAFAQAVHRYPQYELHIYGEGPAQISLEAQIAELGLEESVYLMPPVQDVISRLSSAEIFVLSSNHEGFPNSLAEALTLGLACVATDCPSGGPRAMIQDGNSGFLVPVNNADKLAEKLALLMSDSELRNGLGATGKRRMRDFEPARIAMCWERFLMHVVRAP